MAPLTILSDNDVRKLLLSLTRADVEALQDSLAEALQVYSTGTQEEMACSSNQPHRTTIPLKNGIKALFMPAATRDSAGIKMVAVSEGCCAVNSQGSGGGGGYVSYGASPVSTPTSPIHTPQSSTPSLATAMDSDSGMLPTPSSMSDVTSSSSSSTPAAPTSPRGALTLLDHQGSLRALINAEELTAFRTALAATMLLRRREHVATITVFGAGKQAYWHIRLALLLRGADVRRVNIINRSFARAQALLHEFYGAAAAAWRAGAKFSVLSAEYGEYARVLKDEVRRADVILCCTPSARPLFPAEHLTAPEGRRKGRLVCAVGGLAPHMCELHPDILRQEVAPPHAHHHHRHAPTSGVVVVDSLSACLKDAGEVVQAGLLPDQLVEIGELVMLKRQANRHAADQHHLRQKHHERQPEQQQQQHRHRLPFRHRHSSSMSGKSSGSGGDSGGSNDKAAVDNSSGSINSNGTDGTDSSSMTSVASSASSGSPSAPSAPPAQPSHIDSLLQWLTKGNVIYKSVGLGLVDVVVGNDLLALATERGIGTVVDDF